MKSLSDKPNITVVTGLGLRIPSKGHLVQEELLKNFINVIKPSSNIICVIAGDFAYELDENIHVLRIKGNAEEFFLFSVVRFMLAQIRICYHLYRLRMTMDAVMFISGTRIFALPVICSRLLRVKVISGAGGRFATMGKSFAKEVGPVVFYLSKLLEKINFSLADIILVESPASIQFLDLGGQSNKIIISGGRYVDMGLFRVDKNLQDRKNMIGYIGRIAEAKGVGNFVQAMPLIKKEFQSVGFLIGGEGPLFIEIKNQLKNCGLNESTKLTGWIPHDEISKYLNELRLFVFPSVSEGLPGAVQEAMACGTPVLATPVGGVPDLIKDGETGFIMEDNSPECIAENVIRALEHPDLDEIALNARRLIVQEYRYDVVVKKFKVALDELMKDE